MRSDATPNLVRVWVIGLAMLVQIGLSVLVNQVLFPNGVFVPVSEATGGVVSETLCVNILMMTINIGIVIMLIGRLGLRDIGVWPTRRALLWSICIAGGLWLCAQAAIAAPRLAAGDPALIASPWMSVDEGMPALGRLLGQVFGNALYEEALFRGFLLVQVGLLLARGGTRGTNKAATTGRATSWIAATLLTQLFFALSHVPNRLMKGSYGGVQDVVLDQGVLLAGGLLYAVVYLGTRNLWLCVLLHAMANAPTPLFASSDGSSAGTNVIALGHVGVLIFAVAMLLRRHFRARSSANAD